MMSRKKLFELLNRQKEEQEARSDRESTVSAVSAISAVPSVSTVSSNSVSASFYLLHNDCCIIYNRISIVR